MSEHYQSYTLGITINGRSSEFKVSSTSRENAEKACVEYFEGKDVMVQTAVIGEWIPKGFK